MFMRGICGGDWMMASALRFQGMERMQALVAMWRPPIVVFESGKAHEDADHDRSSNADDYIRASRSTE
jgi:hypothetical protein